MTDSPRRRDAARRLGATPWLKVGDDWIRIGDLRHVPIYSTATWGTTTLNLTTHRRRRRNVPLTIAILLALNPTGSP